MRKCLLPWGNCIIQAIYNAICKCFEFRCVEKSWVSSRFSPSVYIFSSRQGGGTGTGDIRKMAYFEQSVDPKFLKVGFFFELYLTFYQRPLCFNDPNGECYFKCMKISKCIYPTFCHFYAPVEDGTYYVITRGGRAVSSILCPEHISKTMLARVMIFHGWIDLIKAECSAQEP